jgi:hypothetical protein
MPSSAFCCAAATYVGYNWLCFEARLSKYAVRQALSVGGIINETIKTRMSSYNTMYLSIYGSTALVDLGRFFSFLIYTQSAGLLGRGISPSQGCYLHTEQYKQNTLRFTRELYLAYNIFT